MSEPVPIDDLIWQAVAATETDDEGEAAALFEQAAERVEAGEIPGAKAIAEALWTCRNAASIIGAQGHGEDGEEWKAD